MKKALRGILLLLLCARVLPVVAQHSVGPFDLYVSKQEGNTPSFQGSLPASADEGRSIQLDVTNVIGPIQVNPMSYYLEGPPCPTWDAQGHRNPSEPSPNNTALFQGSITVDPAQIPEPGTVEDAQFTIKENGYWTKCRKKGDEKVYYDSATDVKLRIWSIKIALADKDVAVCNAGQKTIKVETTFPAETGSVSWESQNGKLKIVSSDKTKAVVEGLANGEDVLVAKLTVGSAVYKDEAKVKVGIVKFKKEQHEVPWYPGGTLDMTTLLTDESEKKELEWSVATTYTVKATIDEKGVLTYPTKSGGTYTVTAKIKGTTNCVANIKVVMGGFKIVMDVTKTPCDGEEADLHLEPVPANLPKKFLDEFGAITLESKTKTAFNGNPSGKDKLEFAAIDARYKSKVLNCYWYATGKDECFDPPGSIHQIEGKATVNGKEVTSVNKAELTVSLAYGVKACIFGKADIVQGFSGAPTTGTEKKGAFFVTKVTGKGTLKRDPKGLATVYIKGKNSQFKDLLTDEEDYHVGQFEGKNGKLCADLWKVKDVMAQLNGKTWVHARPDVSQAAAVAAIAAAINNVTNAGRAMFIYPPTPGGRRCELEAEAKKFTGIKHGYTMHCGYSDCEKKKGK